MSKFLQFKYQKSNIYLQAMHKNPSVIGIASFSQHLSNKAQTCNFTFWAKTASFPRWDLVQGYYKRIVVLLSN